MELKELDHIMKCSTCLFTWCEMKVAHIYVHLCVWPCVNTQFCMSNHVNVLLCVYSVVCIYVLMCLQPFS